MTHDELEQGKLLYEDLVKEPQNKHAQNNMTRWLNLHTRFLLNCADERVSQYPQCPATMGAAAKGKGKGELLRCACLAGHTGDHIWSRP